MQSAAVMKPIQQNAEPKLVPLNDMFNQMHALSDSIARRAFEIFQRRGRAHGNDLEDWFRAEAELFHGAHVHLYEFDDALAMQAEVPGFAAEELEVRIESRRVTISGKRATNGKATRKILYCDACADRIFRALGLPVEVDPKKATAVLRNGVLELAMPKAAANQRSYAIVREQDTRRWIPSLARLLEG